MSLLIVLFTTTSKKQHLRNYCKEYACKNRIGDGNNIVEGCLHGCNFLPEQGHHAL
jgi:hypothetical protein